MSGRRTMIKIGDRFGRLTVERFFMCGVRSMADARCACGTLNTFMRHTLKVARSCGCQPNHGAGQTQVTHGLSKTPGYKLWHNMITRCRNPDSAAYADYGGRGITVCERWLDYANFYADMGERPPGLTLERRHNDKGYSPDNCCWATRAQQMRNRRNNIFVTINGYSMCVADAQHILGLGHTTIDTTVRKRGITHQQAVDHFVTKRQRALLAVATPQGSA